MVFEFLNLYVRSVLFGIVITDNGLPRNVYQKCFSLNIYEYADDGFGRNLCRNVFFLSFYIYRLFRLAWGKGGGVLSTDLFCKPTDTHQYLHKSSCHPRHTKKAIPYGQALRFRRIYSDESINGGRVARVYMR